MFELDAFDEGLLEVLNPSKSCEDIGKGRRPPRVVISSTSFIRKGSSSSLSEVSFLVVLVDGADSIGKGSKAVTLPSPMYIN